MGHIAQLMEALRDGIATSTPEVALETLRAAGVPENCMVELFEGDLTLAEALDYAAVLRELGQEQSADELMDHLLVTAWSSASMSAVA